MKLGFLLFAIVAASLCACGEKNPGQLLASAQTHAARGEHNAAMIELRNALQLTPEDGVLRLTLGRLLLQTHDPAAAERELRKALQYGAPAQDVLPLLAQAMLERGQAAALIEEFGARTLTANDGDSRFKSLLGQAYLRLGRVADAAAAFNTSAAADPSHLPAQIGLARIVAADGRLQQAEQTAHQLAASYPMSADVQVLLADLRSLAGDRAGQLAALQQAVRVDPDQLAARYALIDVLIGDQQFDAASAQLDAARKLAKGDLRISYLDAAVALGRNDLIKAREAVQWVLKYSPDYVPGLVLAAAVELQAGRPFAAEALLQQVLALDPAHAGARSMLVRALLLSDQPARALETLQTVAGAGDADRIKLVTAVVDRLAQDDPQIPMRLAERALHSNDMRSAAMLYRAIVEREPNNFVALNNLAWAAGQAGEPGAIRYAERAVAIAADNAAALDTLGTLWMANGDMTKAVAYLRKAAALAPDRPDIRLDYAKSLLKSEQKNAARSELKALQSADFAGKGEVAALLKGLQ